MDSYLLCGNVPSSFLSMSKPNSQIDRKAAMKLGLTCVSELVWTISPSAERSFWFGCDRSSARKLGKLKAAGQACRLPKVAKNPVKSKVFETQNLKWRNVSSIPENGITISERVVVYKSAKNVEILVFSGFLAFAEERLHPCVVKS